MVSSQDRRPVSETSTRRAFEWWMVSNLAIGAGFSAFVALLVPPFVTNVTGSASEAGLVMAVMSLAAVLGPVLGGFADNYRSHRLVMTLGLAAMTISFAGFALGADDSTPYALDAIMMGLGVAGVSAVAPVFVVGAGLDRALEARRLTAFALVTPVGQLIGGVVLGAAAAASWSFSSRFWLGAGVMAIATIVTWFSSVQAEERVHAVMDDQDILENAASEDNSARSGGLKTILFSIFGVYLLVLMFSSIASNGINNQISNILPQVYGVSEQDTSFLISLAGLINIGVFILAGHWMGRAGMIGPFLAGQVARLVGSLSMALLGLATNNPSLILVALSMQVLYQGVPFIRLTQPAGGVRFSTIAAGAANGWVIAAVAVGSFVGSLIGGWLADAVGFNAISWMAAIAAGAAVLLTIIGLYPADRRIREREAAEQGGGVEG